MNTSITDKLPIESIGETITSTLPGPVVERLPGQDSASNTKRWLILGAIIGLAGLAVVFWRSRGGGDRVDSGTHEDWSANRTVTGASDRVVA